jgi:glycosyltransferase involved in cell wall biosynthesis
MRVFMLGWEFPPYISGGLGTACFGLTKALSRQQVRITFVLPKAVGAEWPGTTGHVRLLSPQAPSAAWGQREPQDVASTMVYKPGTPTEAQAFANVTFKAVPSRITNPYSQTAATQQGRANYLRPMSVIEPEPRGESAGPGRASGGQKAGAAMYQGDLITETRRYAALCSALARGEEFDVVHAHDWLTFPAGLAVAAASGKPLVVHIHSTEFDRSGSNIHQQIYEIERRGMQAAVRVIAVSHLTKTIIERHYGIDPGKIDVVYNGIENGDSFHIPEPTQSTIKAHDKIVLFLGRITMQKGPEYFVTAAKKVLEKFERVKFVMAGSGDKIRDIIELAAAQGIGHKVLFTGFLRGADVDRVFRMADVYVMPSVSEPFGIAALEAISHDVPTIISKQSGVSEVLNHALKVDFWDTDEMANKIIALLRHPPLASTLRHHADIEVRRLTWDDAAAKCREVYRSAQRLMPV